MLVTRSFDHKLFRIASWEFNGDNFDYEGWIANRYNIMYAVGDNVGIATYEYPGCYTAHWFFIARGKEALDIAFAMYDNLFNQIGAEVVRGITPIELRGARYLAKRIGFISLGIEQYPDGEYEIMCLTKDEFNKRQKERNG